MICDGWIDDEWMKVAYRQCNVQRIYFFKICLNVNTKKNVFETLKIVLLRLTICWPLRFLKRISPSSRYNQKLVLESMFSRFDRIYSPTSSHISALSKLPKVTSKQLSTDFTFKVSLRKNSKDFLQYILKQRSLSSMIVSSFANWMAFVKISLLMDGQNSLLSS